ncbi:MAG: FAD-dependent oxidoreductase [Gammaproteobacteria bacterium]|nr:FAD-dependent oxidoreductase [Gammaproteobacteria bacterium]
MTVTTADFVIIGGGIAGITIALEIRRRQPRASIMVFEKDARCGLHASGRNSGVLHAGFYYTADSLKARFTRDGSRQMAAYCEARGLSLNRCGKLVVARQEKDIAVFDTLLERAGANGVRLERLALDDARRIEPRVKSKGDVLFSPDTMSVDPQEVMRSLIEDARHTGISIRTGQSFMGRDGETLRIGQDRVQAGFVINAAGLYADQIAKAFGFCQNYTIMPFKGLYLFGRHPGSVATNIYPVPDIANPFLGVHYTVSANGRISIGPTAIPAFWREHYRGFSGFSLRELLAITSRQLGLLVRNDFGFRGLAWQEIPKYLKSTMIKLAGELAENPEQDEFDQWGPAGIRAQLVNIRDHSLEMDFVWEGDEHSFHVLNAVSPAFTCSLALSEYFVDQFEVTL